jgi:hypothetical protein
MSTKAQPVRIDRTMEEYAASKLRLELLQAEAIETWDRLARIGSLLSASHQFSIEGVGDVVGAINRETRHFPTVDYIRNLAVEIKMESERKLQLHTTLKNLGAEPDD